MSGEPRPPRAPVLDRNFPGKRKINPARATYPSAPDGEGPVLEWYQTSAAPYVLIGILMSLLMVPAVGLRWFGLGWTGVWWAWLLVLAPIPALMFAARVQQRAAISAGARWFAAGPDGYVRLYELTRVAVRSTFFGPVLDLADLHGGRVSVNLIDAQCDRALWDLVFDGILHSVRAGAEISKQDDATLRTFALG